MPAIRTLVIAFGIVLMLAASAAHLRAEITERAVTRAFLTLLVGDASDTTRAAELIEAHWEPSFLPMALEVIRLTRSAEGFRRPGADHGTAGRRQARPRPRRLATRDVDCARGAAPALCRLQERALQPHRPALLGLLRHRAGETLIRLDEIVWGGVRQDGIPPLRDPAMLAADDAGYHRGRQHRLRPLRQRRRPRLSEAHPRLARDVRRHRRRRAGRRRVLHALRHRDPLSHRARRRESPARHERLPLPLEQAHVRPRPPSRCGARCGARRWSGRLWARASCWSAGSVGDDHLGRVAQAAPRNPCALARYRPPTRLHRRGGLPPTTSRPMR